MYELSNFSAADMISCGEALRRSNIHEVTMEGAACKIIDFLYENFYDKKTGGRSFALARFYKTHPYSSLPQALQSAARTIIPKDFSSDNFPCLTLLATKGDKKEWNNRKSSAGHQAIPLFSEHFVRSLPMVSGLISAFGLEISDVIAPDTSIQIEKQSENYNLFYVPEAKGSPFIPAQKDFVIPYKIYSVIGFGGILPSKQVYVVILFSKDTITKETAEMFKPLARNIKAAILPYEKKVFA